MLESYSEEIKILAVMETCFQLQNSLYTDGSPQAFLLLLDTRQSIFTQVGLRDDLQGRNPAGSPMSDFVNSRERSRSNWTKDGEVVHRERRGSLDEGLGRSVGHAEVGERRIDVLGDGKLVDHFGYDLVQVQGKQCHDGGVSMYDLPHNPEELDWREKYFSRNRDGGQETYLEMRVMRLVKGMW
jgi:hypothetical protein